MSKNKKIVLSFFNEVYNNRNFSFIMKHFTHNYFEHRDDGARTNKDALNITKIVCEIFPDLSVKVEDIIEENNLISIRLTFSGTHSKKYIDAPASNMFIKWESMEFFKIENGIITESWGSWPNYDILNMIKNTKDQ